MERVFTVTVVLTNVEAEGDDEDSLRESVREKLREAILADETGEAQLDFTYEED